MFNKTQPLWLPAGSIRAILALIVVISVVFDVLPTPVSDSALLLIVAVLGGYGLMKVAVSNSSSMPPGPLTDTQADVLSIRSTLMDIELDIERTHERLDLVLAGSGVVAGVRGGLVSETFKTTEPGTVPSEN